jgi:hypothetical protein
MPDNASVLQGAIVRSAQQERGRKAADRDRYWPPIGVGVVMMVDDVAPLAAAFKA